MTSYRVIVAARNTSTFDGTYRYIHLFSTDWMDDQGTCRTIAEKLKTTFAPCKVSIQSRPITVYTTEEV